MRIEKKQLAIILLALIILAYLIFQIPRLNFFYVISDEALYARQSWYIAKNPVDFFNPEFLRYYVPVVPALFAPFNFFLEPVQSVRFGVLLSSIIGIILVFLLGKKFYSEEIGLISAGLLAFSPTFLYFSTTAFLDIPVTVVGIAAIMLAANPLVKNWKIAASAIVIFAIKVTGAVMFPAIIITRLIAANKKISKKQALLAIGLIAIGIIGAIVASMLFGISGVLGVAGSIAISPFLHLSLLFLGQQLVVYTLGYAILPFFLIGIIFLLKNKGKEQKQKNLIITFWAFTIIGAFTLLDIIQSRYFLPAIPALIIVSAFGIKEIIPKPLQEKKTGILLVFGLIALICFASVATSAYFKSDNELTDQGYKELQQFIASESSKGDQIVFFGNDFQIRGMRLFAEMGLQEFKKSIQNPSKEEFEQLLQEKQGNVFVIYNNYATKMDPKLTSWVFYETGGVGEYLSLLGFETEKEITVDVTLFGEKDAIVIYLDKK